MGGGVVGVSRKDPFELRDGVVGVALLLQQDRLVETSVGVGGIGDQGKLINQGLCFGIVDFTELLV